MAHLLYENTRDPPAAVGSPCPELPQHFYGILIQDVSPAWVFEVLHCPFLPLSL